ncbi:MAG: energy transducer TonB [Bacteroidota bacterium]
MTPKKNPGADLEKRRSIHLETGLVVILSISLVCFEWGTRPEHTATASLAKNIDPSGEEFMMRTPPPEKKKEQPRPPVQPILDVVPDIQFTDADISMIDPGSSIASGFVDWWLDQDGNGADEPEIVDPVLSGAVQIKPLFPGGDDQLLPWIYAHIVYPEEAARMGIQGVVSATFVVSKSGKVVDVRIIRGVHPDIDNEVLRVLNMLPDFRPGMQNGKLVPVLYSIPIRFKLM